MAKTQTVASLKKTLWRHFARYIKKRDKNICFTCGKKVEGRNAQAGHYMPKSACGLEYYYSETNVHCQCGECNCFLHGNIPNYRKAIVRKYGKKELETIERNFRKPYTGDSKAWLLERIAYYKSK
ncbi:recombination protein NinG [Paracoccaceae bacterium GXU_MW_L88]